MRIIDGAKWIVTLMGSRQFTITMPRPLMKFMRWEKGTKLSITRETGHLVIRRLKL